jgi:hypothetical protein
VSVLDEATIRAEMRALTVELGAIRWTDQPVRRLKIIRHRKRLSKTLASLRWWEHPMDSGL